MFYNYHIEEKLDIKFYLNEKKESYNIPNQLQLQIKTWELCISRMQLYKKTYSTKLSLFLQAMS